MCKEMPVIPVNRMVEKKRIIEKNGGPRRRTTTGQKKYLFRGNNARHHVSL
jgi:hypothetical protein